jgi:pimeloyl-ACP methyl ester carboxylesterase
VTRFEDYLDQVIRLLPDDPGTRPALVGASMGGPLALKVAERTPVSALVLVNSIPPAGTPGWPIRDAEFPPVIPWSASPLESTRASLSDADEGTIRWAHVRWHDESGAVMCALYEGIPAACPIVPILVIVGEDDDEVPADVGLALGKRLAADTMVFSGVSHVGALLGRRAGLIARLACGWLEGVL